MHASRRVTVVVLVPNEVWAKHVVGVGHLVFRQLVLFRNRVAVAVVRSAPADARTGVALISDRRKKLGEFEVATSVARPKRTRDFELRVFLKIFGRRELQAEAILE